MRRENGTEDHGLKDLVRQQFGEKDKEILEEHLAYIEQERTQSLYHKNKHFGRGRLMRWTAFTASIAGGALAFLTTEAAGTELPVWGRILLTLCSIWGPMVAALLEDSRDTEENKETWLRQRMYVNDCANECLEYVNRVKKYAEKDETDAKRLLLEKLVEYRENNDRSFGDNMNK